ncbi:MAG: hypothetical protein KME17_25635 [Cyanosarcina radialis HA8281-LM2]|jgi:antitoxin component YwqK of YwqJK toxin-antitoxin module|nr:hypothetical protein [Cyanosarcina radialis HA8281-LM2]
MNADFSIVIPADAIEQIDECWGDGSKKSAFYYVGNEKVGYRWWDEAGNLAMEYGLKDNLMHGSFRTWHDNGKLCEESYYIAGKEDGIAKQYDEDGSLIGTYEMDRGTGVDLWYQGQGILAEERSLQDGNLHGYERWWNSDNQTICREQHFQSGIEHGIYREWDRYGRLRRRFPQYFVKGQKTSKRRYLRACQQDESLPKYIAAENSWERPLPSKIVAIAI